MPSEQQTAFIFHDPGYGMEMRSGAQAYWQEHPESAGVMLQNLNAEVLAVEPMVGLLTTVYEPAPIEWCRAAGIPLVNTSNLRFAAAVASVVSDDMEVGRMAGHYLLRRGYRDFIYISHPTAVLSAEREAGFRERVHSAGLQVTTLNLPGMDGKRIPAVEHLRQTQEVVRSALAPNPMIDGRAVFCYSTTGAEKLLTVAIDLFGEAAFRIGWMGVDAPEGKLIEIGEHRITAVRPDFHQVGYEGAKLLAALIRGEPPALIRIPPIEVVEGTTTPGREGRDRIVSTVLKWIETAIHNGDPLQVSALAERTHMSARTLQRRFTSLLGHGVKKEIYARRMRHACELLRSEAKSITEIAVHIGYSNPGEFSRRFRRAFGKSPREWRATARKPSRE